MSVWTCCGFRWQVGPTWKHFKRLTCCGFRRQGGPMWRHFKKKNLLVFIVECCCVMLKCQCELAVVSDGRRTRHEVGGGWPPPVPSAPPPGLHCVHPGKAVSFFVLLSIGVKISTGSLSLSLCTAWWWHENVHRQSFSLYRLALEWKCPQTVSLSLYHLVLEWECPQAVSLLVLLNVGVRMSPGNLCLCTA